MKVSPSPKRRYKKIKNYIKDYLAKTLEWSTKNLNNKSTNLEAQKEHKVNHNFTQEEIDKYDLQDMIDNLKDWDELVKIIDSEEALFEDWTKQYIKVPEDILVCDEMGMVKWKYNYNCKTQQYDEYLDMYEHD